MSEQAAIGRRRFVRSADRAVLGGVCAGLADHFGFNLRATRIIALIALFMTFPMALIGYVAAVVLFPSRHDPERQPNHDPKFEKALRSAPRQTMADVRRRFQALDGRLARLERYVTSSRFNLDQEFRKL